MGWGSGNLGGGSGGLNFKIVGETSKPSNPKENTIWVNTDTKITGWYFSATQPENMAEGECWFGMNLSVGMEFNVLKKNSIQVCIFSAVQCVDGVCVRKNAKIYQDGIWAELWDGTLYSAGDEYEGITGGWVAKDADFASHGQDVIVPTSTRTEEYMTIHVPTSPNGRGSNGALATSNAIDLTNYKTLHFELYGTGKWTAVYIGVAKSFSGKFVASKRVAAALESSNIKRGMYTLDVSDLEGEYIVAIQLYNAADPTSMTVYIYNVYLE